MDQHSIIIRPARPDLEEGRAYARYLDEAAEGFIRFMFGRDYERIIAEAFIKPDNDYSFENAIAAERDGVIVGMASGFTAAQRRSFSDEPLKESAGSAAFRIKLVKLLFAPIMRIIYNIPDSDYYVLAIALDKDARGMGIGTMLLDAMEERGRGIGSARLSLDVAAGNKGARRLYERRGMTVESQWPRRLPVFKLTFYRMVKPV
jgi:ribosomal protein S18 acetylase RimI-like enzyme